MLSGIQTRRRIVALEALTGTVTTVARGGTGVTSLTDGKVVIGNGTGGVEVTSGLRYHGPTACGASSVRSHEGDTTIAANTALTGAHFYSNFVLNAGVVASVTAGAGFLAIYADTSITINGTIYGVGGGVMAPPSVSTLTGANGNPGSCQAGGAGGADSGAGHPGGTGGNALFHGVTVGAGGVPGGAPSGSGTQYTGLANLESLPIGGATGAAGGGDGGTSSGGLGGRGGAALVMIAPTITLGAGAVLNTSGGAGATGGADSGGGGGGGAGNIYMICTSYTDNGATFTLSGGAGGAGAGGGTTGGSGAAGIRQILIYT